MSKSHRSFTRATVTTPQPSQHEVSRQVVLLVLVLFALWSVISSQWQDDAGNAPSAGAAAYPRQ